MKTKYTPGPWEMQIKSFGYQIIIGDYALFSWEPRRAAGYDYAFVPTKRPEDNEQYYNGLLVAAAPDLYEAAIEICESFPLSSKSTVDMKLFLESIEKLRQAIMKAKGEK